MSTKPKNFQAMPVTFWAFINAVTQEAATNILQESPELLSEQVLRQLDLMINDARVRGYDKFAQSFEQRRALLQNGEPSPTDSQTIAPSESNPAQQPEVKVAISPREQHFVALKSKYQVSDYPDSSPTSPLYFLLRKIDLGLELIELELDWLKQPELQQLHRQLLDLQAPRQTAITELTTEFANLKSKYDAQSSSVISWEKTPFYLMLYKLDSGTQLTDSELKWLRDNRFFQTIAFSQKIRYFARLKAKYKATQHPNSSLSSHLYPILKALETNKRLNETEVNWLKCHKLVDTLAIFQQQESVLEAQFAKLKAKYQATQHPESSVSSPLYQILQNFEADKPLSESELNWLTEHQLTETFGLAQEIKPKRHFAELKRQYQATQSEESSPKSHLYKVLKRLDSDNVLTESDINFLKKRKLTETMAIAVKKYAASLKSKAASASTLLSKAEIDWLK
ncbi:MAG TPA: hypothetical protein ENG03_00125, partial [Thioploca sp.]|nr:hypothetical protein [Thioploca sp.]